MKRIVIAAVCLVLAVFLAVFGFWDLKKITLEMHDTAERVITAAEAEDVQTVETELKVFLNQFAKHKKMLGAFVNHGELDEADILVRGLQDKAKEEAYDELSDDMRELQYHFAHLRDTETPRFENIF
ncbi:MAG: DUF4363 family protein [Lachnospiraceae bacterium]